jgi:hypothetical protein
MSLALAIALNAIAVVGLLGLLGYVMTRPARLRPHVPASAPVLELQLVRTQAEELRKAA